MASPSLSRLASSILAGLVTYFRYRPLKWYFVYFKMFHALVARMVSFSHHLSIAMLVRGHLSRTSCILVRKVFIVDRLCIFRKNLIHFSRYNVVDRRFSNEIFWLASFLEYELLRRNHGLENSIPKGYTWLLRISERGSHTGCLCTE